MSKLKITKPLNKHEDDFVTMVSKFSGIGYGRMLQMISGIWANILMESSPSMTEDLALSAAKSSDSYFEEIELLEQRLKEAEEVIGFYDSIKGWDQGKKTGETSYQRARAYFEKYSEKEGGK